MDLTPAHTPEGSQGSGIMALYNAMTESDGSVVEIVSSLAQSPTARFAARKIVKYGMKVRARLNRQVFVDLADMMTPSQPMGPTGFALSTYAQRRRAARVGIATARSGQKRTHIHLRWLKKPRLTK